MKIGLLILFLLLSGCSSTTPIPEPIPTPTPLPPLKLEIYGIDNQNFASGLDLDKFLQNSYSFITNRVFTLRARVIGRPDLNAQISWEVEDAGQIGFGGEVSFQLEVYHPPYKAGTGSRVASPALNYLIIAQIKTGNQQAQDSAEIRQTDLRDIIRQEYVNHKITVPLSSEFVQASQAVTPHFSQNEYNGGNYTYLIFGDMGKMAEEIRGAYNNEISREPTSYGLRMTSGYRNPERNENVGGVLTSSHQYGRAIDLQPVNNVPGKTLSELYCILQKVASGPERKTFAERRGVIVPCDASGVDHVHVGF